MRRDELDPKTSYLAKEVYHCLSREEEPVETKRKLDPAFSKGLSFCKIFDLAQLPRRQ